MEKSFLFRQGNSPLMISIPHAGIKIPEEIKLRMTSVGLQVPDTDWHLPLLYDIADEMGVSLLSAEYSRYVIDLNRPPDDNNLYPGLNSTRLCPVDTFSQALIYRDGLAPSTEEIKRRTEQYWQPYHLQLSNELDRMKNSYGVAVLWDAHSIASQVPRFFSGKLPDLNFGTVDGTSCDSSLEETLSAMMQEVTMPSGYTHVFNGRFKGGYITRHYGRPRSEIHAIQLEMCQSIYMNEQAPFEYHPRRAQQLKHLLHTLLNICLDWAHARKVTIKMQ